MGTFLQWLTRVVGDAVAKPTTTHPEPSTKSGVEIFLSDVLGRVHKLNAWRLPRVQPLRGWIIKTDRGVSLTAGGCCSVHIENEIRSGGPCSLLERIDRYFESTGNIPGAACLLYAVQDQTYIDELREVQAMYPDLAIVVVMTSTDPDSVAEMRALHNLMTSLVGLVVLPYPQQDVESFLKEVLPVL